MRLKKILLQAFSRPDAWIFNPCISRTEHKTEFTHSRSRYKLDTAQFFTAI